MAEGIPYCDLDSLIDLILIEFRRRTSSRCPSEDAEQSRSFGTRCCVNSVMGPPWMPFLHSLFVDEFLTAHQHSYAVVYSEILIFIKCCCAEWQQSFADCIHVSRVDPAVGAQECAQRPRRRESQAHLALSDQEHHRCTVLVYAD